MKVLVQIIDRYQESTPEFKVVEVSQTKLNDDAMYEAIMGSDLFGGEEAEFVDSIKNPTEFSMGEKMVSEGVIAIWGEETDYIFTQVG